MTEIQTCGKPIDSLLEKVLCMNILSSDYFKELYRLKTYHEVIDEIYNQVDHVEPWMTGNCRGPSTAFCLLYKFFTMKLTVKQMHGLLKHPDSPYIRARLSCFHLIMHLLCLADIYRKQDRFPLLEICCRSKDIVELV
ncbi:pre-mRNA splicing factor SR-like 1 isoform X3 [Citrus sinensis]|uniref:pre-mRNA splicing factor SR-like 1 isoform X3 n=1 Tax=Citrus sinensis TaxID=2711 RepID=UPI002277EBB8|nr:pre-mRNA splicing factor SR-like 1 isoform X3 [Citrus sinensis]